MNNIRKNLETCVCSTNTVLRSVVGSMSLVELLRNCHPSFAGFYCRQLIEAGELAESHAKEFPYQAASLPVPKYNYLVYQPNVLRRR